MHLAKKDVQASFIPFSISSISSKVLFIFLNHAERLSLQLKSTFSSRFWTYFFLPSPYSYPTFNMHNLLWRSVYTWEIDLNTSLLLLLLSYSFFRVNYWILFQRNTWLVYMSGSHGLKQLLNDLLQVIKWVTLKVGLELLCSTCEFD